MAFLLVVLLVVMFAALVALVVLRKRKITVTSLTDNDASTYTKYL